MGTEDDGIRRAFDRFSKHTKGMELVKLGLFTTFPKLPGVELAKFSASEVTEGLFRWGGGE